MKAFLKILGYLGLACVLFAIIAVAVIYSGAYNVAATTRHTPLVHASLNRLMINSVRSHADEVERPASIDLGNRQLAREAVGHYESKCVICHGAPGRDPERWAKSLYPRPPDLIHSLREHKWTDREVFWIIKHGVKDTGMAAFGDSHEDHDLWALTALVRQFLDLSPDDYRRMVQRSQSEPALQPTGRESPTGDAASSSKHSH